MDQTLVRSGFDAEVVLGGRYLQYLLLLAVDTGVIPVEMTFADGTVRVRLHVPETVDRTYELDPGAPQPEPRPGDDAFAVEILHDHPLGADIRINVLVHVSRESPALDVPGLPIELFVRLGLRTERDADGLGLASADLTIELLDVAGPLVDIAAGYGITKDQILVPLQEVLNRTLPLGGVGSGGRLQDIVLHKHRSEEASPAALGLYLNLLLRAGPQPDRFLEARGDVALARNILHPTADIVFATRADLYGHVGQDAYFRRAEPSGSGYTYPLRKKGERIGNIKGVHVGPTAIGQFSANQLGITLHGEFEIEGMVDPDFRVYVYINSTTDAEGVMSWESDGEVEAGLFVEFFLAGLAIAFAPLLGAWSMLLYMALQISKHAAEEIAYEAAVEKKVDATLDASLMDIAPNRLTIAHRRWDPFYTTRHQIGLRPGGTLINHDGFALWGRAVLTRDPSVVDDVVIRDSRRVEGTPTHLRYRVHDIDPFREQIVQLAPAADRSVFSQHEPAAEPYLFEIEVDEAVDRISLGRLLGAHPYLVERVEMTEKTIDNLLVISDRERREERNRLVAEHTTAATERLTLEHEARIRAEVIAEFEESGVTPTAEQIQEKVSARLRELIDDDVEAYVGGRLEDDVTAAVLLLLRFELAPTHFGRLQEKGILTVKDFDLIHLVADDLYYYRDRFVRSEEVTPALRMADNLRNRPRYRSTPQGPVFP